MRSKNKNTLSARCIYILVFLSVFLFTLGSYYFYSLNIYLFQIVGLILFVPFCRNGFSSQVKNNLLLLSLFFFYVYVVNAIYSIIGVNEFSGGKMFFPVLVLMCFWFVSGISGQYLNFLAALKFAIVAHCLFFLLQFIYYLLTGKFLDFLEPITGEVQRAFGGSYEISYIPNFIRATGLFNEPGTYTTYLMILFVWYKDLCTLSLTDNRDRWWVEFLVVATTLLSFSTFGYVFLIIYALILYGFNKTTKFRMFLFCGLLIFGGVLFFDYFQQRFLNERGSTGIEFRVAGVASYFLDLQWWSLLFGRGFSASLMFWNNDVVVLQDIGFWFGLIYYFGIFGVLFLFGFLVLCFPFKSASEPKRNNSYLFLLIVFLLLSKLVLTNILVLVVLLYIAIRSHIYSKLRFSINDQGSLLYSYG
jgi:hypothetical protein